MTVSHAKVSTIADDPAAAAAGEILPSDWNAGHVVTGLSAVGHTHAGEEIVSGTVADARVAASLARDSEVAAEAVARDAAIAVHAAAADPHPGYLTPAEGAAAFDALGSAAAAQAAAIAASQPVDADLTAIAALTTTAFGRSLLTLADQAALLAAAGASAAGHDHAASYQPLDSDLTAIAALATTAFGRSLLAAADAGALRTLAGTVIGTDVPGQAAFDDHSARHENGGTDEISVAGLSGALADPQTPAAHAASHQNGGSDAVLPATVSQAEAEAGTSTSTRLWTPERVAQAIAALGVGGGGYPFTLGDMPPASPDARNEEWNSTTPVNTWTNVASAGTPANASLGANRFDTNPAEPSWNADTDIPGALVMQCKQSSFFKRYMAFAPTPGTRWAVMAKLRLGMADFNFLDLFSLQLYKEVPGSAGWNPTDGLALRIGGPPSINIVSGHYNGGSEVNVSAGGTTTTLYVAYTGLTTDAIWAWVSSDGIAWTNMAGYTGLNINGNVNYLALTVFDVTDGVPAPMGVCEFIRFLAGSNNLNALVAGN